MKYLSEEQWESYLQQGYLKLGKVVNDEIIEALCTRIDDIMLGKAKVDYNKMMMQLDSESGAYNDAGVQTRGLKGETLNYRKIQDLEYDELYMDFMQHPLFKEICERTHGKDKNIDIFRAMFMNKPAGKGTLLPWHQDRWSNLTIDPQITIWTALDAATIENGCVEILPGTHQKLINPDHPSGFLEPDMILPYKPEEKKVYMELQKGETVLLHNWLLHSSNVNNSKMSRRAFSMCYMDADTELTNPLGRYSYNPVFNNQKREKASL
jgi:ectoine hydroxylase-related dioxygenase (phytanoyl-CoA dioxygenase family)